MMKSNIVVITLILFLASFSVVKAGISNNIKASSNSGPGGNSTTSVTVNNRVNTGNTSFNSNESQTSTNVEINQEGEGTSQVTINGKTWKQEGPGSISVSENTENSPTVTPLISQPASPSATPNPSPAQAVLSAVDENTSFIKSLIEQVFAAFKGFFSNIF